MKKDHLIHNKAVEDSSPESTHISGTENENTHFADPYRIRKVLTTEDDLRAALKDYQSILDEIEDCVGEVDLKGNITSTNRAGIRIWGAGGTEDIIGVNFRTYMDEETAEFVFQAYNKIYRTGVPDKITYDITRKDGARVTIEDSVAPIRGVNGKITGFRTVSRDITERKKRERELDAHRSRLEAIFRIVKDAIITVEPDMRVIAANTQTQTICNLNTTQMAGKVFSECISQCSRSCIDVLKQTLEKKVTIREYRIECNHQQKRHQLVNVSSSPLLDSQGNFIGVVLVIRDMTLLVDLERELKERHQFQNIIGKSKRMQQIYGLLSDLADLETTVLITGESGTGKELVARALHYSGLRAFKPLVSVNCSALTESLLESELFGHVRGAFTGAIRDRQGRFQAADGGTIFLDEIGDISPLIQLKLLRVLQEKTIEPVGKSMSKKVDVRVIACTNKNLLQKVMRGEFREDLYYRLKVLEVTLPPLRERLEDLPLLVEHFRHVFNERFKKQIAGISNEVLNKFMDYPWPGNIRELEHTIEHAFILCHGNVITMEHLPGEISRYEDRRQTEIEAPREGAIRAGHIRDILTMTGGNKAKAARHLGIHRRTLYRILDKYKSDLSL
ncbi:MAG: sigma 54-interacting transcriptional regulator [Syntrophales bacterium]|nr:sigma 54-interacting transcriptional regulator [Syntrophales bacterium]